MNRLLIFLATVAFLGATWFMHDAGHFEWLLPLGLTFFSGAHLL